MCQIKDSCKFWFFSCEEVQLATPWVSTGTASVSNIATMMLDLDHNRLGVSTYYFLKHPLSLSGSPEPQNKNSGPPETRWAWLAHGDTFFGSSWPTFASATPTKGIWVKPPWIFQTSPSAFEYQGGLSQNHMVQNSPAELSSAWILDPKIIRYNKLKMDSKYLPLLYLNHYLYKKGPRKHFY